MFGKIEPVEEEVERAIIPLAALCAARRRCCRRLPFQHLAKLLGGLVGKFLGLAPHGILAGLRQGEIAHGDKRNRRRDENRGGLAHAVHVPPVMSPPSHSTPPHPPLSPP